MNRSPLAMPWIALLAILAVIAGAAVTVVSPGTADAQDSSTATLSLHVSEPSPEQPFRTLALAVEPGTSAVAAIGAAISFDVDDVVVSSCAVSEVGACNVTDGQVLVSVFNLGSLRANEQLLTVNFEPTATAASTTTFGLTTSTAVNNRGEKISAVTVESLDVEIVPATFGSLTGTVVAAESATALFDIDVCVTNDVTGDETCTTTSGLGNWRLDELETGTYGVAATDRTGVYATTIASGFVTDADIALVNDIAMQFFTLPAIDDPDESAIEVPSPDVAAEETVAVIERPAPIVIMYEASIAGRVTGLQTESPIVAAQVCATQPLVLHQSCATTDADGVFALSGLSTGNYWVEVIDPLGQFEQTRAKLVGVVGDDVERAGVRITMVSVTE